MSIPVPLERLAGEIDGFGDRAYLLTVSDDGRPHAVSVSVTWDGEDLVGRVGARSARNARQRRLVTLLFAPGDDSGYSLIVDGEASVPEGDVGGAVRIRPSGAVLHARARTDAAATPTGAATIGADPSR